MSINSKPLDAVRRSCGVIENALIDSHAAGRISRRDFLRHCSVLGLSAPGLAAAIGSLGMATLPRPARAAAPGGTLRIAQIGPASALEPVKVADPGGITQLSVCGEYLCVNGPDFTLRPSLAESWSPNSDGSIWTFRVRNSVTFHNGKPLTAADVVASFERLTDPDSESNALTAFAGYLSKGGTRQRDDATVEFHLDAANGNFPYLVSSDSHNAIILPADYRGDYETNQIGTGPFKLESYTPRTGASYLRQDSYWGAKALPDRLEFTFHADDKSQAQALRDGQADILSGLPRLAAAALSGDPAFEILRTPATSHNQLHMRTDMDPFRDPRVRRAVALCLDRPKLVQGLFAGRARIGNDSPFAPDYPSTDKAVSQRQRDVAAAKQLLEAAGLKSGFQVALTAQQYQEIPAFALAIQDALAEIGGKVEITTLEPGAYYADGVFGKSPWLDCVMGITDYVHQGAPNAHLTAPLRSDGAWNSARYKNPAYDRLVTSYIAALEPESQRKAAGEIQKLLLDETPVIFGYFHDHLTAVKKGVSGVVASPLGHLWLAQARLAS